MVPMVSSILTVNTAFVITDPTVISGLPPRGGSHRLRIFRMTSFSFTCDPPVREPSSCHSNPSIGLRTRCHHETATTPSESLWNNSPTVSLSTLPPAVNDNVGEKGQPTAWDAPSRPQMRVPVARKLSPHSDTCLPGTPATAVGVAKSVGILR